MKHPALYHCPMCGRRIHERADHLPRCPALGRPKG